MSAGIDYVTRWQKLRAQFLETHLHLHDALQRHDEGALEAWCADQQEIALELQAIASQFSGWLSHQDGSGAAAAEIVQQLMQRLDTRGKAKP